MSQFVYLLVQPKIENTDDVSHSNSEPQSASTSTPSASAIPSNSNKEQIIKVRVERAAKYPIPKPPKPIVKLESEPPFEYVELKYKPDLPKKQKVFKQRKTYASNGVKWTHLIKPCVVRLNKIDIIENPELIDNAIVSKTCSEDKEIPSQTQTPGKFKCDQCPKTFTLKGNLKRHVQFVHLLQTSTEKFPCDKDLPNCTKVFKCLYYLQLHIDKVHQSPEKRASSAPVECEICGKPFSCKQYMFNHRRSHNGRRYSCKICSKEFTKQEYLYIHKKVHYKQYSCEFCGKLFSTKANLNSHEQIHTGEKKLKCEICGENFRHYSGLNMHKVGSHGQKSFECTEEGCGMKFVQYKKFKDHKKKHSTILVTIKTEKRI